MSRYASPWRSRTFGCVAPAMTYSGAGRRSLSIDSASIAHSMPLPGPSRPHVNTRAGPPLGVISAPGSAPGVAAPCGISSTFAGSMSKPANSRVRAVSVITTTASAAAHTRSSTTRWFVVGSLNTVWATTTIGTSRPAINSMIDSPSAPSYKPYSCWTMTTSLLFNAATAAGRSDAATSSRAPITNTSSTSGDGPHRTTSTDAPSAIRPAARAAENVAIPQDVGGNVDRMPIDVTVGALGEAERSRNGDVHDRTP